MFSNKNILLIIGGGIAAYKSLELIRRLQERGASVQSILTHAATQFITPLSVGCLTADKVHIDLFNREDEQDVGHIRLARECDCIVIAPATADIMAKMATGLANDLASTVLLATDCPILAAPAMNPHMWNHPATKQNIETLKSRGISFVGPEHGEMAEKSETGIGRMSEPEAIADALEQVMSPQSQPLADCHVIVTSGPTIEPIDPVRVIANRSSGKQGHAIAQAAARAGARVTLISGPVSIADPTTVKVIHVETALEMLQAVESSLPADIAILAAAVADWRVESQSSNKVKKIVKGNPPTLTLVENPDILARIGNHPSMRPKLVIGFAAESENLVENAKTKLERKGADWMVANDINPKNEIFGGDSNDVSIVSGKNVDSWPRMGKIQVANRLIEELGKKLKSIRKT